MMTMMMTTNRLLHKSIAPVRYSTFADIMEGEAYRYH